MMLKSLSKKAVCLLLIMPILISLTVLGMRVPTLGGFTSGKLKPRPRAVMQTQIKKIKDSLQFQCAVDCTLPDAPIVNAPQGTLIPATFLASTYHALVAISLPSRSPPPAIT